MKSKKYTSLAALLLVSATAYAFPWDIDLVDSPALKGYKWRMMDPAENTISQEQSSPLVGVEYNRASSFAELKPGQNIISAKETDAPQLIRVPEPNVLTEQAPIYAQSKADAEKFYSTKFYRKTDDKRQPIVRAGEVMAKTYCQACHIVEAGALPSPVTWSKEIRNQKGDNVKRWGASAAIKLAGQDSVLLSNARYKNDDVALYDVIRNGWGQMPAYGHAMYDHEIWATISYLRSVSK